MNIKTLGIDIGQSTFHLVGLDEHDQPALKKKLSRAQLMRLMANRPACLVGLEACSGSPHLARRFSEHGHRVRLMPAQFVKPYVKSNKSDFLDAEAIAEAVTRPTMRFVPVKTPAQQDRQALHRVRSGCVAQRTTGINPLRAFLLEYGLTIAQGIPAVRRALPAMLEDADNGLSGRMRGLLHALWPRLLDLDAKVKALTVEIDTRAKQDETCRRLLTVPGIGPLTATALVAAIGDGQQFRRGRDLAAWLGLVPRQHSTGGKPRLPGISKRGNTYVRTLFIHGARAGLQRGAHRADRLGPGLRGLRCRTHHNVAAVALANKLARIAWTVLVHGTPYQPQLPAA